MTWDEAKTCMEEKGCAVCLPEDKGRFQIVMKDGQLYEQSTPPEGIGMEVAIGDISLIAQQRTDWEESTDEVGEYVQVAGISRPKDSGENAGIMGWI